MRDFESFYEQATGHRPYGYQARIARDGLPGAVRVPTGAGKTGVILAWLWRRLYGPELGEPFRTAGLCLYRGGRDSVAWHGDTIGRGSHEDTMVAILSLGTARPLLLRPRVRATGPGGGSLRFEAGHGDLLVMGGSCQRTWEHAVPKSLQVTGPRISVQFRPRGVR